jgi:hypothetical protein
MKLSIRLERYMEQMNNLVSLHVMDGQIGNYITDIEDAFRVIKKLRRMDNCCIKLSLDVPGNHWRVEIKGMDYECISKATVDGHPNLCLQISLAALKSVGYDLTNLPSFDT